MSGRIIESIAGFATNPNAVTTVTMATGDSATVRTAPAPGSATLLRVVRAGATAGYSIVQSPQLHDSTRGIRAQTAQAITTFQFPRSLGQPLVSSDALTIQVLGGAAETDGVALMIEYANVGWASGRYAMVGDIKGLVRNIKIVEVDFTTTATGSAWKDTAINTTEDLMHAGHDYAVLGVLSDTALAQVGLKGPDIGNFRFALPCPTSFEDTSEGFVRLSEELQRPAIPIINADNRYQTFLSAWDIGGAVAVKTGLVLAELTQRLAV